MQLLNSNKVLCIGAYVGDVEYSLYGTILKKYKTQFTILVLEETTEPIMKESMGIWHGIQNVDGKFGTLEDVEDSYDLILTCPNEDLDVNRRETYKIGLDKFINEGISFCTYKTITSYDIRYNLHCDITGQYNKKTFLLEDLRSLSNKPHLDKSYMEFFNTNNMYSNLFGKKVESLNVIGQVE